MKKSKFSKRRIATAFLLGSALACSIVWAQPSLSHGEKSRPQGDTNTSAKAQKNPKADNAEELQLVQSLEKDGLINQARGFVLEKHQHKLFIDGTQIADSVAYRYIAPLKKDVIRVAVPSLAERQKLHPRAGYIQLLFPVLFSSPCVDMNPKPGC